MSTVTDLILEELADGKWASGEGVILDVGRKIPPGEASRMALKLRERGGANNETAPPMNELVASGRRHIVRRTLTDMNRRGRLEFDVEMTRKRWQGGEPWQVRDTEALMLTVREAADHIDITESVLRNWIDHGYVPRPHVNRGGLQRVTPEQLVVYQRVRKVWGGPGSRWMVEPKSVWQPQPLELSCPHCGETLVVSLDKQPLS